MAKILIGVVTYGKQRYCLDEFLHCLKNQSVKADILFVVNNGESAYASLLRSNDVEAIEDPKKAETRIDKILNGRKHIREYALQNEYDYLFFVDSDIMLPLRALEALLATKTDVATGVYLNAHKRDGKTIIAPVLYKDLGNGTCQQFTYEGTVDKKLLEVGAAGFGCTLITKKVLEAVDFRTISSSASGGEDIAFYVDARSKGFKTIANTFVKCTHRPYPKSDPRARAYEWPMPE